jgi:hypothetical protein
LAACRKKAGWKPVPWTAVAQLPPFASDARLATKIISGKGGSFAAALQGRLDAGATEVEAMETLKSLVAEHPFARGLEERYVHLLEGCASNVVFKAGELIFREGGDANDFYLIRHGKVALEVYAAERGSVPIMTAGKGEVLGWSWLFPPYRWQFDACPRADPGYCPGRQMPAAEVRAGPRAGV